MTGSITPEEPENPEPQPGAAIPPRSGGPDHRRQPLSHELGTPLNAVLGNLELVLDGSAGPLSQKARECLADAQAAGQDLLRHTRRLLLLVQALEQGAPADQRAVGLEDLFGGALEEARGERGEVSVEGRHRSAMLIGDPFWLKVLARCIVDLYLAARPTRPLRITVDQLPTLSIGWPGLDLAAVPASACALISRIVVMHGGRMHAAIERTFVFSWPASPGRGTAEVGGCAD